ncbi:acyl-CoA thioester hydrolase [Allocatelliglobosispora scoriae]|uniref:Acyl-CoA thioester hydrolase n=1 Tax=Allocatelliglobosispora scoriae TaxID=643052 RepID=A0A841BL02_9ACTN|nr:hypothetical protein [Allocatelliglobosispora scoriae]MBB5867422.1 acyl-CoA thioester hydrolase [Allocatelliglobosispora scoriae]
MLELDEEFAGFLGDPGAGVTVRHEITWMDTDASSYWHNTTAMRLVEQAESLLHRSVAPGEPFLGLARVHVEVSFTSRLGVHDLATVRLLVLRVGTTSIEYAFTIRGPMQRLCAKGRLIAVQVEHATGRTLPWSAELRRLLLAPTHLEEAEHRVAV